ncbi:DUF4913 domain-containing protein [Arthrobacter sp. V1I9]|uniref:DUF4913 domain-containing protein n=1 Tax=Arthrobacter sp. V1I9 TaxID=3042275 RepID=UPI0027D81ADC|nr:DUF4913 domain-containing protein [Arthrobacter sp. V1I9]
MVSFVQEHLSPSYRRSLSGTNRTWGPSWWKHEEAISRPEALWRAWEFLRLDGPTAHGRVVEEPRRPPSSPRAGSGRDTHRWPRLPRVRVIILGRFPPGFRLSRTHASPHKRVPPVAPTPPTPRLKRVKAAA